MDAREASQLVLDWHDRQLTLNDDRGIALGTAADADLTVGGDLASRSHAHIELRNQVYVLVDHSTNGTFVQQQITTICPLSTIHSNVSTEFSWIRCWPRKMKPILFIVGPSPHCRELPHAKDAFY